MRSSAGAHVVLDAAVLALFVPAEASVGDVLLRHVLQRAQHHVVVGHLDLAALHRDLDQLVVGAEQRAWCAHGFSADAAGFYYGSTGRGSARCNTGCSMGISPREPF